MGIRKLLGIVGALVLAIGSFSPVAKLPLVGQITYFMNGKGNGTVMLAIALVCLIIVFLNKFRLLYGGVFAGFFLWCTDLWGFLRKIDEMSANIAKDDKFSRMIVDSIGVSWGWAIMLAGLVLLGISAGYPYLERAIEKKRAKA